MSQQQYRLRQLTFQTLSASTKGGFASLSTAPHDAPLKEPAPHPLADHPLAGHWAKRWGTRFRQDDSGSTTVEFALCIIPFVMVTIGIIEVMLMFFTIATIEGAMDQATRMVRTGELQTAASPENAFQAALCEHTITIPCVDIRFEMVSGDSVAAVNEAAPFWEGDEGGNGDVDIGGADSFVIARAAYDFQFITPLIGTLMGAGLNNEVPIRATAVVRNEPF